MGSLFDGTKFMDNVTDIYNKMEVNYPSSACSKSEELWKLQYECNISPPQGTLKIMLDKAVAMLAKEGHMPGWFNRCPVASGITDPSKDRNYRVDLVRWCELCRCARLVELKWDSVEQPKWKSNDPLDALRRILRYGAAYLFCRVHKRELPLQDRPLMNASHVSLEVVAPRSFCRDLIGQITKPHGEFIDNGFVDSKTGGTLTMSLKVLAFPDEFQIPFADGAEVTQQCDTPSLTPDGQAVRDAFNKLVPVWPAP